MRTLNRLALGALLVLAACGESNDPPPPPPTLDGPITLSATSMWAGESLTLASADFAQVSANDSVIVVVGGSRVRATRIDETHFSINVPADRGGTFDVKVQWRGLEQDAPQVTLYGFDRFQATDVHFLWDQLVIRGPEPQVLAGDNLTGDITLLNVVTGGVTRAPNLYPTNWYRGPGPTYIPGVYLVSPLGATRVQRWRLHPTIELLDSLPLPPQTRQYMQFSPFALFRSSHHEFSVSRRTDSTSPFLVEDTFRGEETEGALMSPRGDRATILIDGLADGVPVFRTSDGALAWRATSLHGAAGGEFNADGSRLLFAGPDSAHRLEDPEGYRVEVRDATSGAVEGFRTFNVVTKGAAFDPASNLVYVVGGRPHDGDTNLLELVVLVFRRPGLELVTQLEVPLEVSPCHNWCYKAVAAVSDEPALYVITDARETGRTARWRFTLPPVR